MYFFVFQENLYYIVSFLCLKRDFFLKLQKTSSLLKFMIKTLSQLRTNNASNDRPSKHKYHQPLLNDWFLPPGTIKLLVLVFHT